MLAVSGCNSIFGSHDVINGSKDADVRPKDAAPYTMYVTGMTYDTTKQPATMPDSGMVSYPALANVTAAVGKLGEAPQAVPVESNTGAFTVPYELAQGVYRIIYTPPDGVPVEIQGKLQSAHFVAPSLGRPDAVAAPANALVGDLLPSGGPNSYVNLHLFAIGTYAVRLVGSAGAVGSSTKWTTNANMVDSIQSMSGGLYTPEGAKGDRLVIVDNDPNDHNTAYGFSVGTMTDFSMNGGLADPAFTPWKTTQMVGVENVKWSKATSDFETSQRIIAATSSAWKSDVDDGSNSGATLPLAYAGLLPTTKLPNFVEPGASYQAAPLNHWAERGFGGLAMPLFLPMSTATTSNVAMVHVFNGTDAPAFPTALYLRYSRSGTYEGVPLTSGIQTIAIGDNTTPATVPTSVGLAYTTTQQITLNGLNIWTDNGASPNTITNAPAEMDLVFGLDKAASTDDCVSTFYQISGTTLVPVHRFISTPNNVQVNATIQVDKSIFVAGHDYVLGISCHAGLPGVTAALDWTQLAMPYYFSESVTWSHPFNVQ